MASYESLLLSSEADRRAHSLLAGQGVWTLDHTSSPSACDCVSELLRDVKSRVRGTRIESFEEPLWEEQLVWQRKMGREQKILP